MAAHAVSRFLVDAVIRLLPETFTEQAKRGFACSHKIPRHTRDFGDPSMGRDRSFALRAAK